MGTETHQVEVEATLPKRKRGRPPKLTAEQAAAALKRLAAGDPVDDVGEAFGMSGVAISKLAARSGIATTRRRREDFRSKRPAGPASKPTSSTTDGSPRARLVELVGSTRQLRDSAQAAGNSLAFARLVKTEQDLLEQIDVMDRTRPPDPAQDPANVRARDAVLALIRSLVDGVAEPTETRTEGAEGV